MWTNLVAMIDYRPERVSKVRFTVQYLGFENKHFSDSFICLVEVFDYGEIMRGHARKRTIILSSIPATPPFLFTTTTNTTTTQIDQRGGSYPD